MGRKVPPGGVKGSYYLDEDWNTGTVFLSGNRTYADLRLKYNLYDDELEVFLRTK